MEDTRKTVFMVDDNPSILAMGKNLLKPQFKVFPLSSAAQLFTALQSIIPDLILLDIEMPKPDGYEVIKRMKADVRFSDIPVIFLTARSDEGSEMKGFDLGATDYISKPFSSPLLLKRIENQLLIAEQRLTIQRHARELSKLMGQKTVEVQNLQMVILSTIGNLLELRDKHTGKHIVRVQLYVKTLIEGLFNSGNYLDEIVQWNLDLILPSIQLYDVGKIAIPETILNKPRELDLYEKEVMKTHVQVGLEAVRGVMGETVENDFLRHAIKIVESHHERWDGSGYPYGISGHRIPLEARMIAIADVYDALISWRPYKKAYPHAEAKRIIEEGSGTHFDPVLVQVFRDTADEFYRITQEYSASEAVEEQR
ncbi:MAG: response regulator [Clostridiales bacterium]|jgi:putative two-component system response regulator|nr:response regulator [Clostridiales bacterium]